MNHKIVCWGDYAIPVPLEAKWMAMDKDGRWYRYRSIPTREHLHGEWGGLLADGYSLLSEHRDLIPPEPGPWTDQLYWIGD